MGEKYDITCERVLDLSSIKQQQTKQIKQMLYKINGPIYKKKNGILIKNIYKKKRDLRLCFLHRLRILKLI